MAALKIFHFVKPAQKIRLIGANLAAAIFIAGCASASAPLEQMAVSRVAVKNASSAGGNEFAPLPLKSAMDKMDSAERAMVAENYVLARRLAEQAQVDVMCQHFSGHKVKQLYTVIRSLRATNSRWQNVVAHGCKRPQYIQI